MTVAETPDSLRRRGYPVMLRNRGELRIWTPYRTGNKALLHIGRVHPVWNPDDKTWRVPKSHFEDLTRLLAQTFGGVFVVQQINVTEICAPACMNARGVHCECSCMGAHHGEGSDGSWYEVAETLAVRHAGAEMAVRFIVPSNALTRIEP